MRNATAVRELKLVNIGDSRGIRLPQAMLLKYGWDDSLILEETEDGVFLRGAANRLSWEDTARAMAAEGENWCDLEATVADGLD